MTIIVKNKETLIFDEFIFKCCVGKNGFSNSKIEGDKKPLKGNFHWGTFITEKTEKKTCHRIKNFGNKKKHGLV